MSASIQYYNMGKSAMSNLRITAEGEGFKFPQSPSQYVGNFESGKNNYYDLAIIPEKEGEINGKVIFTFEDIAGKEEKIEKEFKFMVSPAPVPEVTVPETEEASKSGGIKKVLPIGIGAFGILIALNIYKKHKKYMFRSQKYLPPNIFYHIFYKKSNKCANYREKVYESLDFL